MQKTGGCLNKRKVQVADFGFSLLSGIVFAVKINLRPSNYAFDLVFYVFIFLMIADIVLMHRLRVYDPRDEHLSERLVKILLLVVPSAILSALRESIFWK